MGVPKLKPVEGCELGKPNPVLVEVAGVPKLKPVALAPNETAEAAGAAAGEPKLRFELQF